MFLTKNNFPKNLDLHGRWNMLGIRIKKSRRERWLASRVFLKKMFWYDLISYNILHKTIKTKQINFRKLIEWLELPCSKVCRMGDDVCKLDCCRLDCKIRGKPSVCCHCDSGHFCVECCSGRTDSLLAHTEKNNVCEKHEVWNTQNFH